MGRRRKQRALSNFCAPARTDVGSFIGRAILRTTLVLLLLLVPAASAQTLTPTIIAGDGMDITDEASRGDGGPATEGRFHQVDGLDWSQSGSILVADGEDGRIRRITPSGTIVTNSTEGLADPIAVVSTGFEPHEPSRHNFVVADVIDDQVESWFLLSNETWEESVAMVDIDAHDVEAALDGYWVTDSANGTVWHLTFFGFPVGSWHQAPALEGLNEPTGVGPLPGGGFLVATNSNAENDCRIRRRADGVTTVVAGSDGFCTGAANGGNGDGGPATDAWLGFPSDVEATPDGGFVMIERDRLRHVATDGTISTVYVTSPFFCPDCPGAEPTALEVTPDGDVLIGLDRQVLRFDTNYAPPATTPPPGGTNPVPPPPPGAEYDEAWTHARWQDDPEGRQHRERGGERDNRGPVRVCLGHRVRARRVQGLQAQGDQEPLRRQRHQGHAQAQGVEGGPEGDQASAPRQEEGQGEHQAHRPRRRRQPHHRQRGKLTADFGRIPARRLAGLP